MIVGSGLDGLAAQAGAHVSRHRLRRRRPEARGAAATAARRRVAQLVEAHGFDTVLFAQSILGADVAASSPPGSRLGSTGS